MKNSLALNASCLAVALLAPTLFGGELLTLGRPRGSYAVTSTVWIDPTTQRPVATNYIVNAADLPRLEREANAGNLKWQRLLAKFYWLSAEPSSPSRAQAYKWAYLAAAQNDVEGKYLTKEFDVFMKPEEVQAGRELALAVLKQKER